MLCDNCKERDSVVQLTQIVPEGKTLLNLCEKCAAEKGVQTALTPKNALGEFLLAVQKQLPAAASEAGRCRFCSATLRDFRQSGRLGCAHCYSTFEASMRDLLRRVHGHSRHSGKRYVPPATAPAEGSGTLAELQDRLRRAVENEQFELAAELRDRIRVLE